MFNAEHCIITVGAESPELDGIATTLQDAGYSLSSAATLETALNQVPEKTIALILVDQRFAEMSVFQSITHLPEETDTPVIFLVDLHDIKSCGRACNPLNGVCQHNGHACLSKPVDMVALRSLIKSMLLQSATIKALRDKVHHLSHALDANQKTSMTVGVLMERLSISSTDAFNTLRKHARSNRSKISHIAEEIIASLDQHHHIDADKEASKPDSTPKLPGKK